MVIVRDVRSVKTKPKFLAADTSAFSSGDCAWYSSYQRQNYPRQPAAPARGGWIPSSCARRASTKRRTSSFIPNVTSRWPSPSNALYVT